MRAIAIAALLMCAACTTSVGEATEAVGQVADDAGQPDAGTDSDCPVGHACYTLHSDWPIRCDDAGNCYLVDAGAE